MPNITRNRDTIITDSLLKEYNTSFSLIFIVFVLFFIEYIPPQSITYLEN